MSTTMTKGGCLWIVLVIGIFSLFGAQTVKAGWGRLVKLDECTKVKNDVDEVCLIYDKQAKVNCYVYRGYIGGYASGSTGGIYCVKAE